MEQKLTGSFDPAVWFPAFEMSEWESLILKEVKGSSMEELSWELEEGISFSPAFTQEKSATVLNSGPKEGIKWINELPFAEGNNQLLQESANTDSAYYIVTQRPALQAQTSYRIQNLSSADVLNSDIWDPFTLAFEKGDVLNKEEIIIEFQHFLSTKAKWILPAKVFSEAGATLLDSVTYALGLVAEITSELPGKERELFSRMILEIGINNRLFHSIAVLQASRNAINALGKLYDAEGILEIRAVYLNRYLSGLDVHTNLVRLTTAGIAAHLGAADTLSLPAFSSGKPMDFTGRMSANIFHILNEESGFGNAGNVLSGSGFFESLVRVSNEKVWNNFTELFQKNDFFEFYNSGQLLNSIVGSGKKEEDKILKRKSVFIGVNKYPDPSGDHEVLSEISTQKEENNRSLKSHKISNEFEQWVSFFSKKEATNEVKVVYIYKFGTEKYANLRADFVVNLLGTFGIKCVETNLPEAVPNQSCVVLCSSDEEYLTLGINTLEKLNKSILPIIAGNPTEGKLQLNEAGIVQYLHIKSDLKELFEWFKDNLIIK